MGWGDFHFLPVNTEKVLAMCYEWRNNSVIVLHNLDPEPREVRLALKARFGRVTLVNVLSDDHSQPDKKGNHCILLEPFGYHWYRVGAMDELVKQSDT